MTESKRAKLKLGSGEQRLNPRYPRSTIWDEKRRREHRRQRDRTIEDAGLEPDTNPDSDETE